MDWPINPKHVAYAFHLEYKLCSTDKFYFLSDYINKLRAKYLSHIFLYISNVRASCHDTFSSRVTRVLIRVPNIQVLNVCSKTGYLIDFLWFF
jgi:hypothetical protein